MCFYPQNSQTRQHEVDQIPMTGHNSCVFVVLVLSSFGFVFDTPMYSSGSLDAPLLVATVLTLVPYIPRGVLLISLVCICSPSVSCVW